MEREAKEKKREQVAHDFPPVYDENSRLLILGSFPSVKSREGHFYYHHPQNRFWKVLAALTKEPVPGSIPEKKALLLSHGIAIWDVIASCRIIGSSDSSIEDVTPADISRIVQAAPIQGIFTNGATATKLYRKYCQKAVGMESVGLPSTSPANAAYSLERLVGIWGGAIRDYLK